MRELDPAGIRQRIRQARKQLGLTQQELADALQVHKRTVENYENTRVPPWDEFNSLAEVLGVSVGWLLHGDAATQAEAGEGEVASALEALEERQGLVEGALRGQEELLRELLCAGFQASQPKAKLRRIDRSGQAERNVALAYRADGTHRSRSWHSPDLVRRSFGTAADALASACPFPHLLPIVCGTGFRCNHRK